MHHIPILSKSRGKQPATSGIGKPYTSPIRRQSHKTKVFSRVPGLTRKIASLQARLAVLKAPKDTNTANTPSTDQSLLSDPSSDWVDDPVEPVSSPSKAPLTPRRTMPDLKGERLYRSWKKLIPSLVDPLNCYISNSIGKPLPLIPNTLYSICHRSCTPKLTKINALFYDREFL